MPRHNGDGLTRATGRKTVSSRPQPKQRKAISDETEPQIKTSQKRRATRGICSSGSLLLSAIGEVTLALIIRAVAPKDGTSKEYRQNNQGKAPRSTNWPSEWTSSTNGTFFNLFCDCSLRVKKQDKSITASDLQISWSGRRESNPRHQLGRLGFYH